MRPLRLAIVATFLSVLAGLAFCAERDRDLPASILALQPKALISKASTQDGASIELVDLNPSIGRWILVKLPGLDGTPRWAHLDLGQEGASRASLTTGGNLLITPRDGPSTLCRLDSPSARAAVSRSYPEPFTPICGGGAFIRSKPSKSYKSNVESATDWLREQGPMGEKLITWRKDLFPQGGDDAQETFGPELQAYIVNGPPNAERSSNAPANLSTGNLGVRTGSRSIPTGAWAPVLGAEGVWVSISAPAFVAPLFSKRDASDSLAYFLAIELDKHDPRYSVGVDHPSAAWSPRAPLPREGSGPDGFSTLDPLDRVGIVPPWAMARLTAVIAGGFKREHSAFKAGPLSILNHGSHYGFAEAGVVLSKLNPGLATFFQRAGEPPQIKVWGAKDEAQGVDKLLFARQNGMPLIEGGKPGSALDTTYAGNWSGNQDGDPETMRSALCIAERAGKKFLIYGVFSRAVPKDMAQLLLAYGCKDALQMDMNAPVLAYAAVVVSDPQGHPRYMPLIGSMDDKNFGGTGRFTTAPDTRDFIYFDRR